VTSVTAILLLFLSGQSDTDGDLVREPIDYPGIATLALGTFGFFYALDHAATSGWGSGVVLASLAFCVLMYGLFVVIERRTEAALIPKRLWGNGPFFAAVMLNGLLMGASFTMFVYVPQLGQKVWGLSDFRAALLLVPAMVMFAGVAPVAGHLYDRVGPKLLMWVGYGFCIVGCIWFAAGNPEAGYVAWLLPAELCIGIAVGLAVGPSGTAAVASVGEADASVASGITFQWHLVAGALGIAIATFFVTSLVTELVAADEALGREGGAANEVVEAILSDRANAGALEGKLSKDEVAKLKGEISNAYLEGFRRSYWVALVFAVVALFFIPRMRGRE
jgi:MFS family permease